MTAPSRKTQDIAGWMSINELIWLAETAKDHQVIVEIGSNRGRSTRALADHCPGTVHAVDPWPDDASVQSPTGARWRPDYLGMFSLFKRNLADHIATGKVVPHREFFEQSSFPEDFADMLFIDGEHSALGVARDLRIARRVLKPDGLMCGHDYGRDPGVALVVDKVYGDKVQNMASKYGTIWWVQGNFLGAEA